MTICTFIGQHEAISAVTPAMLDDALNAILGTDTAFTFYTGGRGEFDDLCASAVCRAKHSHPSLKLRLALVLPHLEPSAGKLICRADYDDILFPGELVDVYDEDAIARRDRWMIDRADYLLAYLRHRSGSAVPLLSYDWHRPELHIIDFGA